jgi:hypothetical protein
MNNRPRVGVIGGGIFGLSCAINLDLDYDVTVFERGSDILLGATYANHNRHHYGFHYPRSFETAQQCLGSSLEFETLYGDCIIWDFDNYYCVAKEETKTTAEDYMSFCDQLGLKYSEQWPEGRIVDKSKIALCLKVKEGVYEFNILKKLIKNRINATSTVEIKFGERVVSGYINQNDSKVLIVDSKNGSEEYEFDFVINAMYANYNQFCDWFDFEKRLFQYNLQELDIIELPIKKRLGVTVQDGPFPSFLPLGRTNWYLLAHVETSQLIRKISLETTPILSQVGFIESNWNNVLKSCSEYIPLLNKADYVRSIFVDRVVDATRLDDDARMTDVTNHGKGCWSIFAAKIITCETTAKNVTAQIKNQS